MLDHIGAIESVKAASDIYTPVSGDIFLVNEKLTAEPSLINKSAEVEGITRLCDEWACSLINRFRLVCADKNVEYRGNRFKRAHG